MIPKEIEEAYNEYLDKYRIYKEKYISWLRGNIGMIFKMKSQEPFHVSNPFNGGGSTTVFNGYCKIVEDSDGKIIVRIMHMDGISCNSHPGIRFCVSVKNFTGYTYESLMEILDFPIDREDLIPFV